MSSSVQNSSFYYPALRIAIDGTALYGVYGGVEYSLWNLLAALHRLDSPHQFVVFIPQDGPPAKHLADFGAQWQWRRLLFEGAAKLRRIGWQQRQLPALLRRERFDLLHAPTYVAPLRAGVPVVLGVYDLIALTHPQFATRTNRLHYRLVLPRALRRAARIIVPGERVRADVEKWAPGQKGRIRVVPLGAESLFHQTIETEQVNEFRARYQLPDDFLLFVGNFEPKKNIGALLEAHELLPHAPPLMIAGGARSWRGHEIAANGRVRLLGYVPRRELPLLYAACAAFVFPTLAEGFGLPVLEALCAGAPVVTTRAVALPHLDSVAQLCDPHDPHSIAEAIQTLLENPAHAAKRREAGRDYGRAFTWHRAAQQTLAVYEEIGKGKARP